MFPAVILRMKRDVTAASAIKNTITSRMDWWEAGCYAELVNACVLEGKRRMARWNPTNFEGDAVGRRFNSMVYSRKLRGAVRGGSLHFLILVVKNNDGHTAWFLDGQEGASQGDPLSMLLYGGVLLPLVEQVNEAYPGALIPWFTGSASNCAGGFHLTCEKRPQYGYFPVAEKSYPVCKLEHEAEARVAFVEFYLDVKYPHGHRYLRGFIGSASNKHEWIGEAIEVWSEAVKTLAKITAR